MSVLGLYTVLGEFSFLGGCLKLLLQFFIELSCFQLHDCSFSL